jgi:ribonuclease E
MDEPRDQQIVWQTLAEAVKPDKAQPQIGYFSDIGLIEMTRRRQRQSLLEQLSMDCPHCQGIGRVRNQLYRSDILSQAGADQRIQLAEIIKEIVHEPVAIERPAGVRAPEGEEREGYGRRDRGERGDGRREGRRDRDERRRDGRDGRRPMGGERPAEQPPVPFAQPPVPYEEPATFEEAAPFEAGEDREGRGRRRRRRRGGERPEVAAAGTAASASVSADEYRAPEDQAEVMPWEMPLEGGVDLKGLDELAVEALAELDVAGGAATFEEEAEEATFEESGTDEEAILPFVRPAAVAEPVAAVTEDEALLDTEPLAEVPEVVPAPAIESVTEAPEEEEEVTIKPQRRGRRPAARTKKAVEAEEAAEAAEPVAVLAEPEVEAPAEETAPEAAAEGEEGTEEGEGEAKKARTAARRRVRSFGPRRK